MNMTVYESSHHPSWKNDMMMCQNSTRRRYGGATHGMWLYPCFPNLLYYNIYICVYTYMHISINIYNGGATYGMRLCVCFLNLLYYNDVPPRKCPKVRRPYPSPAMFPVCPCCLACPFHVWSRSLSV